MEYCANDPCENEATHIIIETETPLCWTCHSAYKWGQAGPWKETVAIEDYDPEAITEASYFEIVVIDHGGATYAIRRFWSVEEFLVSSYVRRLGFAAVSSQKIEAFGKIGYYAGIDLSIDTPEVMESIDVIADRVASNDVTLNHLHHLCVVVPVNTAREARKALDRSYQEYKDE
jgi:hypothetical protein